jgi:hypothetical protein
MDGQPITFAGSQAAKAQSNASLLIRAAFGIRSAAARFRMR